MDRWGSNQGRASGRPLRIDHEAADLQGYGKPGIGRQSQDIAGAVVLVELPEEVPGMWTSRFDDARAIIEVAPEYLEQVCCLHQKCVDRRKIDITLRLAVKHLVDDLCSALDYCARGAYIKCRPGARPKDLKRNAFPYVHLDEDERAFEKVWENKMPCLSADSNLFAVFEGFQPYKSKENRWLPDLIDIYNAGKHDRLVSNVWISSKGYRVSATHLSAAPFVFSVAAEVTKKGTAVLERLGENKGFIPNNVVVESIEWEHIAFEYNKKPVVSTLEQWYSGVKGIVTVLTDFCAREPASE